MPKYKYDWSRVSLADKDAFLQRTQERCSAVGVWTSPEFQDLLSKAAVPLRTRAEVNADKIKVVDHYHRYISGIAGHVTWNGMGLNTYDNKRTYAETMNALYAEETSD